MFDIKSRKIYNPVSAPSINQCWIGLDVVRTDNIIKVDAQCVEYQNKQSCLSACV